MSDPTMAEAIQAEKARLSEIATEKRAINERRSELEAEEKMRLARIETLRAIKRDHEEEDGFRWIDPIVEMSRTDAIETILNESPESLTPKEIQTEAIRRGRDDDYESVNATLAHLSRTDRAYKVSRGQWLSLIHISEPTRPY